MRMTIALLTAAALLTGTLTPLAANAQGWGEIPGPHPRYIHALSDLRAARHYLADNWAWDPVRREDNLAIRQIDDAINSIKAASIDDGKGLNDPFHVDTQLSPQNRFVKANELLWAAHQDLAQAEDVPQSRGLRDLALRDVDAAHGTVDQAVRIARWQ